MIRLAAALAATLAALSGTAAANDVSPLRLTSAPTPRLNVPKYDTSGSYPQLSSQGADLGAVNAVFRGVVLLDQHNYAVAARKVVAWLSPSYPNRGVYETSVAPRLVSASSVVA